MKDNKTRDSIAQDILLNKDIMINFPKVELHRHLEGSMPIKNLFELSNKNKIGLPENLNDFQKEVQFPRDQGPDFLLFLSKFRNNYYKSEDDVYYITYESVKNLKNDGIYYIELRFSPEHYCLENNFDRQQITKLIIEAGNKAAKDTGIKIKYLVSFNRNKQTQEEMLSLYNQLKKLKLDDIVGIDLAGDELNFPPRLFTKFFSTVFHDGLYKMTIHAGEVTPPEQIWDAIFYLYASRIGHGVATIKDPELQLYLKDNGIYLEQCITSNKQTGAWVDEENHPLGYLFKKGVPVTMNSDDPVIQNTDLTDDYIKSVKYFDFSLDDLIRINLNALSGSFLSQDEKKAFASEYIKKVEDFKKKFMKR